MRFKRIIALLCAAIYISISGAAAAELPQTAPSEEVALTSEAALQTTDQTQVESDLPTVRATTAQVVPSTHHVEVNGKIARASYEVKEGDLIEIRMGSSLIRARVRSVKEFATKDDASSMYEIVE